MTNERPAIEDLDLTLVETIRRTFPTGHLAIKAADEIARLTEEVERLDWVLEAASTSIEYSFRIDSVPIRDPDGLTENHAIWLLVEVANNHVSGAKAHRWLAWAQCILTKADRLTLEMCKSINKAASDAALTSYQGKEGK